MRSLPADKVDTITRLMHQFIAEDVSTSVTTTTTTPAAVGTTTTTNNSTNQEEATGGATTAAAGTTRPAEEGAVDERPNKRSRKEGKDNLPRRKELAKIKDTPGKIKFLLELEKEVPESKSTQLTNNAKTWCYTTLCPILGCYRLHHNEDVAAFSAKYPKISVSLFYHTCCAGAEGTTTCSPKKKEKSD